MYTFIFQIFISQQLLLYNIPTLRQTQEKYISYLVEDTSKPLTFSKRIYFGNFCNLKQKQTNKKPNRIPNISILRSKKQRKFLLVRNMR